LSKCEGIMKVFISSTYKDLIEHRQARRMAMPARR
jgi:hypothetical protein